MGWGESMEGAKRRARSKNQIEGAAEQGERAKNRKALVVRGSGAGRAVVQ